MSKRKVSVIIVNYNGKALTVCCLKALETQSFKDFEILIVNNGSLDNSLHEIEQFLEGSNMSHHVKLISFDKNLGFAGANLEGLKRAGGEYIALLNNDTEPGKDWLRDMILAMDSEPLVGICASKIIVHGTDILDSAGNVFSFFLRGFNRGEGEKATLNKYNKSEYIFGACAGAALYRRKMIEEIGFLDEDFFLIHEDIDLSLRAQMNSWKVLYVPTAYVYHKVSSSIGKMSPTAVYYTLRNTELVRIKNVPLSLFLRNLPGFVLWSILEFLYFAVKHRYYKLYFKAKFDAISMVPIMLKKRRAMRWKSVGTVYQSGTLRTMESTYILLEMRLLKNKLKKFIFN